MTFAKTAYLFDTKRIMYLLPHFCLHYLVYATCISSQDHLYPELIYLAYATCISFDSLAKQGCYYFNICMGHMCYTRPYVLLQPVFFLLI